MAADPVVSGRFPDFAHLMNGWFHQDYDIVGFEISEALADYTAATPAEERTRTRGDIARFLAEHGATDDGLRDAFERVFNPVVVVEGWDDMNTRGWMTYVDGLLAESLKGGQSPSSATGARQ